MNPNLHIIQRQQIEVLIPRRFNALAVQQRLDQLMAEQVLPRLEPVFDRLAGPDIWIEFGRLEVDAVRLPPDAPDAVWGERLFQACVQALEHQLEQKSGEAPVSGAQSVLEALAVFLERGHLPWWAAGFDLEMAVQQEIPRQPRTVLALLGTARARQRWVRQFADPIQQSLLEAVAPGALPLTPNQWERLASDELPGPQARYLYWETLWEAAGENNFFPENWIRLLLRQTVSRLSEPEILGRFLQKITRYPGLGEAVQDRLPGMLNKILQEAGINQSEPPVTPGISQNAEAGAEPFASPPGIVRKALITPLQDKGRSEVNTLENLDEKGLYVPLAGIVLIHPFLPAFFERLGLLDAGQWRDGDARERAVHLLYFLATGLQHPREDELVLLKPLAGMAPDQPVARELDLGDTEKKEAQHLLEAVIDAWDALESSNPDDLRGSFLVREGKLQRGDLGWKLTVEQKAWDILLSQLPWGISPILHSWMGEMIWVDWG